MVRVLTPEQIVQAAAGLHPFTCDLIHDGPCLVHWIKVFIKAFKFALKFYFPLHFVPVLIRYKSLLSKPASVVRGAGKQCLRSTLLLTMMVFISKVTICVYLRYIPVISMKLLVLVASLCVTATFIESPARVSELALYVMPRFLDALWKFFKRRGLVVPIPAAHTFMFSASLAAIMYCSKYEPEHIKPTYRKLAEKFFGEN